MIIEHEGQTPRIHQTAYIAPNAVVSGDVEIGARLERDCERVVAIVGAL